MSVYEFLFKTAGKVFCLGKKVSVFPFTHRTDPLEHVQKWKLKSFDLSFFPILCGPRGKLTQSKAKNEKKMVHLIVCQLSNHNHSFFLFSSYKNISIISFCWDLKNWPKNFFAPPQKDSAFLLRKSIAFYQSQGFKLYLMQQKICIFIN